MPPRRRRSSSREASNAVVRSQELPLEAGNAELAGFKGRLHSVKTQQLNLDDGTSITIARVKVPVPKGVSGHLIRRFDTEALSASSLFRVAFPTASDAAEQAEMTYLTKRYNTKKAGDEDANGAGKLTGTWLPLEDATELAKEYGVLKFASELIGYETPTGPVTGNGAMSSPAAPTPRKSKSPAPPTSAGRSKRARVASPPLPASNMSTRSLTSTMHSLAVPNTPSKASSVASDDAHIVEAAPATRSSRRKSERLAEQHVAAEEPANEEVGGIQVTQEIITDNETGQLIEETKVTFSGADAPVGEGGLIGTDEQAREAIENARRLVASLKEEGVLPSGASKRGREEEDENDEAEIEGSQPGFIGRMFGRKRTARKVSSRAPRPELGELQVMQSPDGAQVLVAQTAAPQPAPRRRFIAMAGMVIAGAATAAAPYFFQ